MVMGSTIVSWLKACVMRLARRATLRERILITLVEQIVMGSRRHSDGSNPISPKGYATRTQPSFRE
ncbi:MAG: hypothetical protein F6K56_35005 [Moorea sp. SIO3G5]|nr:hypothetical protein [Moorena sp. SIO3G5]